LASVASAQTQIAFGVSTNVAVGTSSYSYSLIQGLGPFFNVTFTNSESASVSVTVTSQLYASTFFDAAFSLVNSGLATISGSVQSYLALSFDLQAGFSISTTPSNANVGLTVGFPTPDALSVPFLQEANVNAGLLKIDSTNSVYTRIPCNYVQSPYTFVAMIPAPCQGSYAISAVNEQVSVSTSVAVATAFAPAHSNQTFGFAVTSTSAPDLQINFQSASQNNITVTPLSTQPSHPAPTAKGAFVNAYWSVTLSSAQAAHTSQVTYSYTDNQVKAAATAANVTTADAAKLVYVWADQAGAWTTAATSVSVSAHTATCTTTHFSDWSLYYQAGSSIGSTLKVQLSVMAFLMLGLYLL